MHLRFLAPIALALTLPLAGCSCGDDDGTLPRDSGSDARLPDGALPDGGMFDGEVPDAPLPDGATPDGGMTGGPVITICPGDALPPPATGTCTATSPGATNFLLITGDILTPGEVFRGGQMLVEWGDAGRIRCVGCDCSTAAGADTASTLVCPDAVVSPGLINAHDHLTFTQGEPYSPTAERYEHRHDWRRGLGDHTEIPSSGGASAAQILWGELRFVLGGGTSVNGSGGSGSGLRNLDADPMTGAHEFPLRPGDGTLIPRVRYDTFPLGDSSAVKLVGSCDYPSSPDVADTMGVSAYTPHVAEGIDDAARNEMLCARSGSADILQMNTAVIHGIGLLPPQISEMAHDGTSLIWSPRSNVTLYGDTARLTEYDAFGVNIALGTDWIPSGSMNVLRELRCADFLNAQRFDHHFTDEQLWLMATANAARALGFDEQLGTLAVDLVADVAIFATRGRVDHRAVIDAEAEDVVLVLRGAVPIYGDAPILEGLLPPGTPVGALDVCGTAKGLHALAADSAVELARLQSLNGASYPLFFCDDPPAEPSCLPERNADPPLPSPVVDMSTRYSGMSTVDDPDGDGIGAGDNCPAIFNPVRPVDRPGEQADFDGDTLGDACDPCPVAPESAASCPAFDPTDRDFDGVPDLTDGCPDDYEPAPADRDGDGRGDACDPCPDTANPAPLACPSTVYAIKRGEVPTGTAVSLVDLVVTGIADIGFFAQVDPASASYAGADFSGIFAYTGSRPATLARGDRIEVDDGEANFFDGQQWQLGLPTFRVVGSGAPSPDPVIVTAPDFAVGSPRAPALDGLLVRIEDVIVTSDTPPPTGGEASPTFEFEVTGGVRINDLLRVGSVPPMIGSVFRSITGLADQRRDLLKINPRDDADLAAGPPVLLSIEPALTYAREGATGPTIPAPLTVRLSGPAEADTTITLVSSDPTGLTVTDVVIPTGATEMVVPVGALTASPTPYTITASYLTRMFTADVRVFAATETPRLVGITPATIAVPVGLMTVLRAGLDLPAPAGGLVVDLAVDMGGATPMSVAIPADAIGADFVFVAGDAAATATITAMLAGDTATAVIDVLAGSLAQVVINEIDYQQTGADTREFVEIFNRSGTVLTLDGLALIMVNGSAASRMEYRRVALTGTLDPDGYVVIGNAAITGALPAGVTGITIPDSSVQNGAPDAVFIYDTVAGSIVDSLSYTGEVRAAIVVGVAGTLDLVEGTASTIVDPDTAPASLARIPDGRDTDDNATDFVLSMSPTPGAANAP